MDPTASEQDIAAALAYEKLHVPALFRQFAPVIAEAARIGEGDRVLDIACGTGVLARDAADKVGHSGQVAGIDPDRGMLAVAGQFAPMIDWRQGVAEDLPFSDGSFDAVVSQFGLMFFRDRQKAVTEMLRVLAPGGRLAVAVWDSLERSEAYPIEVALLDRLAGVEAASALCAPFVLGDKVELSAIFREAGAESIDIRTHHGTARFPGIRTMVEADLRGWLPVMGVNLSEATIDEILTAAETELDQYVRPDGMVEFDTPAHIVTGSRPVR